MYTEDGLLEGLTKLCNHRTIIVGVGNTLKGDDGAGSLVCRQLVGKVTVGLIDASSTPENYIQQIRDHTPQCLLIIDAIDFGAVVGAIASFEPEEMSPAITSTHGLSPRLFVDAVCRDIGTVAYFIGIQPAQTELGHCMSPEVSEAVHRLVRILTVAFGKAADTAMSVKSDSRPAI